MRSAVAGCRRPPWRSRLARSPASSLFSSCPAGTRPWRGSASVTSLACSGSAAAAITRNMRLTGRRRCNSSRVRSCSPLPFAARGSPGSRCSPTRMIPSATWCATCRFRLRWSRKSCRSACGVRMPKRSPSSSTRLQTPTSPTSSTRRSRSGSSDAIAWSGSTRKTWPRCGPASRPTTTSPSPSAPQTTPRLPRSAASYSITSARSGPNSTRRSET